MKPQTAYLLISFWVLLMAGIGIALSGQQDRQYTLKGTTEQMIALRTALEQSTAPYKDVIKVQEWLLPQLIQQDQAFAKADSVSKAKGAK